MLLFFQTPSAYLEHGVAHQLFHLPQKAPRTLVGQRETIFGVHKQLAFSANVFEIIPRVTGFVPLYQACLCCTVLYCAVPETQWHDPSMSSFVSRRQLLHQDTEDDLLGIEVQLSQRRNCVSYHNHGGRVSQRQA